MTTGAWRKSSRSNNSGACVEILEGIRSVSIRDSKYLRNPLNDPAAEPIIVVTTTEWSNFIDQIAGRLPALAQTSLHTRTTDDGTIQLIYSALILAYTPDEWEAFLDGVHSGEFDCATSTVA